MSLSVDDHGGALPVSARRHGAVRFGAYMLRRFGWFYYASGMGLLGRRLRFEAHSVEQVRAAAERGSVVYVLLRRSAVDHLALNRVLRDRRLPLSLWADGVTSFLWQPVLPAWRDLSRRLRAMWRRGRVGDPVASGWLARAVASGATTTLFVEDRAGGRTAHADAFEAILQAQEATNRPIQVLPVVVVWSRAPDQRGGGSVRTWLEGSREAPSLLGRVRSAVLGKGDGFVQVGEPVSLPELIARVPALSRAHTLRTLVRRYLRRESRVVRGPRLLPKAALQKIVLDNPPMRRLAQEEAAATGRDLARVQRDMARDFNAIAADFRWWVIRSLDVLLRPVWTRVFDGVDVRDEDIERVRAAMRRGAAVLVPSHKSHFDYLLLSWVLYQHDLVVPHVVAGINLAIPGVASILRRAGGFFIRRSLHGDRVFSAVFQRYLRELLRHGYPVEFFIEGGRTRSGKLLSPKLGVLGMVVDAADGRAVGSEVTLLPIGLAYERVAEEGAYARELGGAEKRSETLGAVIRATSVLRRKFGRVYLRVGEPIDAGEVAGDDWRERSPLSQRAALREVGETLMHRIGGATVVLPSSLVAMALLGPALRGQRDDDVWPRVDRFRQMFARRGALESAGLAQASRVLRLAMERFRREGLVEALEGASGERVWAVPAAGRLTLDFYKNQALHWLNAPGLVALATRGAVVGAFSEADLAPRFQDWIWTLRRELTFDPEVDASALLLEGLEALEGSGALAREGALWRVEDADRMGEVYGLFRSLGEAYLTVLRVGPGVIDGRRGRRDVAKAIQAQRDTLVALGSVTRPEALSLVTLENAVAAFTEEGVFVREGDRLVMGDAGLAADRVATLSPAVDPAPLTENGS